MTDYYVKLEDETFEDAEQIAAARSKQEAMRRGAMFMFSELGDYAVDNIQLLDDGGNLIGTFDAYLEISEG